MTLEREEERGERERERERKKERNTDMREKHQSVASCTCPDGDQTHNLGMCPDWELNL